MVRAYHAPCACASGRHRRKSGAGAGGERRRKAARVVAPHGAKAREAKMTAAAVLEAAATVATVRVAAMARGDGCRRQLHYGQRGRA